MNTARRIRVLLNPSAHSGRARRHLRRAGICEWVESRSPGHFADLVRTAQDEDLDTLAIAGGDGTVALAINALGEMNRVPLALLPAGSGNDFAHQLGIDGPAEAVRTLEHGEAGGADVGRVGDAGPRFCCVASVGLDELALRMIHCSRLPRSRLLNIVCALRALCVYRPRPVRVQWQGGRFEGEVMFVAVTNTRRYGGGFVVSPRARIDDGRLDLCIVQRMPRVRLLCSFPSILRGTHGALPGMVMASSPWVKIDSLAEPLPVALDGELPERTTPVELHAEPGFLQVLRPRVAAGRGEAVCSR